MIELNLSIEPIFLHCIIHCENLCSRAFDLELVMPVVIDTVNFIRNNAKNHNQFQEYLKSMVSEFGDVIFYLRIRWLSRGNCFKRFLQLIFEIDLFLKSKEKFVLELSNLNWICNLAFMVDTCNHLNILNTNLQGKQIDIVSMQFLILGFIDKLSLWISQIENDNYINFEETNIRKENVNNILKTNFIESLKKLKNSFNLRFNTNKF